MLNLRVKKNAISVHPEGSTSIYYVTGQWQYMDEEAAKLCTRLGLATVQYSTVGVYHYRVTETRNAISTCSVIVNPGPKVNPTYSDLYSQGMPLLYFSVYALVRS